MDHLKTSSIFYEVHLERQRQDLRWGEQNHPDGTGLTVMRQKMAQIFKDECERATYNGTLTFLDILQEEVAEAFAESDTKKLRAELIQVAAVAVCWVEAIDRRK